MNAIAAQAQFSYPALLNSLSERQKEKRAVVMKMNLNLGGKVVEVEKMEFKPIEENWNLYRLEDGSLVKLRMIVSEIFKLPGSDPVTGIPQFLAKSSNVMAVEPPTSSITKTREVH